jgi:hypothetical protein
MTTRVQLQKKISDREPQGAWRQDELIGGKPPVVKLLWLGLWAESYNCENLVAWDWGKFGNPGEGWRPPLEAATGQRLVKT